MNGRSADRPVRAESAGCLWVASMGLPLFISFPLLAIFFYPRPEAWKTHLGSETVYAALFLTLKTTGAAILLCVLLGTPLAYLLARYRFRGRELLDTLVDLPMTVPPVVAGVALLLAFGRNGFVGRHLSRIGLEVGFTAAAVVMAQVFIASPFYVKAVRAGFEAVDPKLESAARTLGASRWRVFRTISLPQARPSIVAGLLLAWGRALSEFGATMMFAGNFPGRTQTLPLAVMTAMENDLEAAVVVSAVSLALALLALVAAKTLARRWGAPVA